MSEGVLTKYACGLVLIAVTVIGLRSYLDKRDPYIECTFHKAPRSSSIHQYLLYLPPEYGDSQRHWPLVLFLHGAGEVGNQLDLVKHQGLPRRIAKGWKPPFIMVAPQTRWSPWNSEDLIALLDGIQQALDVDRDRVYLTGLSLGGAGTWAFAAAHPDRFAGVVPICGSGDPETAEQLRTLPIWVFHGAKDDTVPLACSEEMVTAVEAAGGDVRLTVYPDATHDSWTKAYSTDALYDWMLSHTRPK